MQGQFSIPECGHEDSFAVGGRGLVCQVEGWAGNVLAGYLTDFRPEHRSFEVLSLPDERPMIPRFSQVRLLKIEPGPEHERGADRAVQESAASPQSFAVHLKDGTVYSGKARAWRKLPYGLWIFPAKLAAGDPHRVFIPRAGISSFEFDGDQGVAPGDLQYATADFADTVGAAPELPAKAEPAPSQGNALIETRDALQAALESQGRGRPMPIGEALLALDKITAAQLSLALHEQATRKSVPLGQVLIEQGLVTNADLQQAFVTKMGYPCVDLRKLVVDTAVLRKVPTSVALRLKVLPLMEWNSALVVAMADPLQYKVLEELEFTTQRKVRAVVANGADLPLHIAKAYRGIGMGDLASPPRPAVLPEQGSQRGMEQEAFVLAAELAGGEAELQEEDKPIEQSDNTLVRLINSMITEAYHQRASDIHIEPYPGREKVVIRFRVDGQLRPYLELPPSYRSALVARIKIMCELDIAERRKPQDGKINFAKYGGLPIELRVATIPTAQGLEDIVMRLLTSYKVMAMESLDLSQSNLAALAKVIERPYGLFLCVGPTGSGKTTTLHSVLQRINRPDRKIWTAEDPVEITQRGLRQIQVNPKIGWTFAAALRSLLRADPDVIMVGEIRDHETAEMAIEASLTGHLVLSTLHTNSAAETIVRLNDLGVDSFSFADSLQGILAQRLARRLCPSCVKSRPIRSERLQELLADYQRALPADHALRNPEALRAQWLEHFGVDGSLREYHALGCDHCGQTGFFGRLALHELLIASPAMRQLVQQRARPQQLRDTAINEGMRTLRQDGIEKVLAGLTTLTEVRSTANE
ncbi:MAG: hypothetical protein RJA36_2562 [Pseudomonadota bacterium]